VAAVHGYTTAFTVSAALLALAAIVAGVLIKASRHEIQPEISIGGAVVFESEFAPIAEPVIST
jgi:hypothetical protein